MISLATVREIHRLAAAAEEERCAFRLAYDGPAPDSGAMRLRVMSWPQLKAYCEAWDAEPRPATLAYKRSIKALGESDMRDLEALMWFGRGDETFADCRAHSDTFPFDDGMRHYVTEKPLDLYLARAIEKWPGPRL